MKPKGSIFDRKNGNCINASKHEKKKACPNCSTWWARVIYIDPETNQQHDRQRRAENKAKARDLCNDLLNEIEKTAGRTISAERMTFADLCDRFEKDYLKEAEYNDGRKTADLRSLASAKCNLAVLRAHFGHRRVQSLSYSAIEDFRNARLISKTRGKDGHCADADKHKENKPCSTCSKQRSFASVHRELALLKRILNVAVSRGWRSSNPFDDGDPLIFPANERKRQRILTVSEEKALLDACDTPHRKHIRPLVIAALDTGCRLGELLKLRWRDIDWANGQIKLLAFNTKTQSERSVGMTARVKSELEQLRNNAPDDPFLRVFGIPNNCKRAFTAARQDAGLPDLRFHDLRHSAATRLVRMGIPLAEVGRVLGHAQISTTYRYVNADMETAQRAAAALDQHHANAWNRSQPAVEMVN